MQVITRAIRASDGITYPEGTPLDKLPAEHRHSLAGTCWTRRVVAEPAAPKPASAPAVVIESSDSQPDPEESPVAASPPAMLDEAADDSPAIASLDLPDDVKAKLVDADIHTVAQAKAFAAANKGFRTIKGVVRATNEQILAALGE